MQIAKEAVKDYLLEWVAMAYSREIWQGIKINGGLVTYPSSQYLYIMYLYIWTELPN